MRVLFIGPLPEPVTGQSLACRVFLEDLRRDHQVDVVNLRKQGFGHGMDSARRVGEVLRIVHAVWRQQSKADAIYFTVSQSVAGNLKDLLIYLACLPRLSRMMIHLHGGAGLRRITLGKRGLLRRVNEWFVRRLGGAIVLGSRHTDVFAQALPAEKIHVVPNFAQDYLFTNEAGINRKFRQAQPLRILFLSNLIPGKGYPELLDAFFSLDERARDAITIDFAGAFDSKAHEREFLNQISGFGQLRYHGVVEGSRKRDLLQQAHVFCLPTYFAYEGQPISILEAYAAGCAVITTDHSGIFDVFTPGVNGYEVEKRAVGSLVAALRRAIAEPDQLRAMAQTNLVDARQHFRAGAYNAELTRLVHTVAGC